MPIDWIKVGPKAKAERDEVYLCIHPRWHLSYTAVHPVQNKKWATDRLLGFQRGLFLATFACVTRPEIKVCNDRASNQFCTLYKPLRPQRLVDLKHWQPTKSWQLPEKSGEDFFMLELRVEARIRNSRLRLSSAVIFPNESINHNKHTCNINISSNV